MNLTLKDAADLLQVSEDQVSQWITARHLPARLAGDHHEFDRVELLEWAWKHKQPIRPGAVADSGQTWVPMLASALELGGIHYDLPGHDKTSVYQSLIDALPLPASVDRDHLRQFLMVREALCPTGIGDGLAIPHPRNPVVIHADQPVFAIGFPATPIADFGAIDNKPVTTLLTIISPTIRLHLRMLASLTAALHRSEVVRCLDDRARPEELIAVLDHADRALTAARNVTGAGGNGP